MKHIFKFPLIIITLCAALTVFFALQMGGIHIDNDNRIYFPKWHSSYKRLLQLEEEFGSIEGIGIALEQKGKDIITSENIALIEQLTEKIELTENVKEAQTLTNIDFMSGENNSLNVHPLVQEDFSGTQAELSELNHNIADWLDMYDGVVLSYNKHGTMIMVTLDEGLNSDQKQKALSDIRSVVLNEIAGTKLNAVFVGDPVMSENSKILMQGDLVTLIPLVALIVLLCLFFSFRTVDGTILPLITVIMSACWSVGLMAMVGATFTIVSTVIPVVLIAVGSAYGIHMLNHYYITLKKWGTQNPETPLTKEIHKQIVLESLNSVILPIVLAGITTVAGFFSLITSPLNPLKTFAIFSSAGISFALILSVTFIPAVLMVKSPAKIRLPLVDEEESGKKDQKETPLFLLYTALSGTKVRAVLFMAAIVIISVFGLKKLTVDTAFISYFPKNGSLRKDVDYIDQNYAGTNSLYFIVDGHERGALTNPEILEPLEALQQHLESTFPQIGKVVSLSTFVKRMNQVMHIPSEEEASSAIQPQSQPVSATNTSSDDDFSFESDFDGFDFEEESESPSKNQTEYDPAAYEAARAQKTPDSEYLKQLGANLTLNDFLLLLKDAQFKAGKNASVQELTEILCQSLNYNGELFYEVPSNPQKYGLPYKSDLANLVSQYLLLYSGSLDDFIDNQLEPSKTKVVVQMRERSSALTSKILQETNDFVAAYFPEGYSVEASGIPELEYTMTNMIVKSQITSLIFSLACVFVIIAVSFKSPLAGIIGCIPLILTILLNYMVMGLFGISLDMFTSLIASLAVGIGIDYTIHFMTEYRNNRIQTDDLTAVTHETLRTSGKGIITNALSVGIGFLILCFSNFVVLRYIGILVAAVMFSSSVLAMTVIPAILNTLNPKFMRKK